MQSVIIYLVCYFYALKASKKLLDSKNTKKILRLGLIVLSVALVFAMLWQFITIHNGYDLCHTFSFVIPQLLNCFVSIGFIAIGLKISKAITIELALK